MGALFRKGEESEKKKSGGDVSLCLGRGIPPGKFALNCPAGVARSGGNPRCRL